MIKQFIRIKTREDVEEKLVELGLFNVGRKITDYEVVRLCSPPGFILSGSINGEETQCYAVNWDFDMCILYITTLA